MTKQIYLGHLAMLLSKFYLKPGPFIVGDTTAL